MATWSDIEQNYTAHISSGGFSLLQDFRARRLK